LNVPLEVLAFNNYVQSYLDVSEAIPESPHSLLRHILLHGDLSKTNSTLSLAVASVSLAVFGRTKASPAALSFGNDKYIQALTKTKTALGDASQVTSDQLILTVMMLNAYEVRLRIEPMPLTTA
jgi:hypothetical protein